MQKTVKALLLACATFISCGQNEGVHLDSEAKTITKGPKKRYQASGYFIGRPLKCSEKATNLLFPVTQDCDVEIYKIAGKDGFDGMRISVTAKTDEVAAKINEYKSTGQSYVFHFVVRHFHDMLLRNWNNHQYIIKDVTPIKKGGIAQQDDISQVESEHPRRGMKTPEGKRTGYIVNVYRQEFLFQHHIDQPSRWPRNTCRIRLHEGGLARNADGDTRPAIRSMSNYSEEACEKLELLVQYGAKVEVKYSEAYINWLDYNHIVHSVSLVKEDNTKVDIEGLSKVELKELLLELLSEDEEVKQKVKEVIYH